MKKFMETVMEWKTNACLMFTGFTLIYVIVSLIMGFENVRGVMILSFLLISALTALIQLVAFSDLIIKNISYTLRLIIFIFPLVALLGFCAYFFRWFPTDVPLAWLIFIGIFIVVFAALTLGFEIYFHYTGKKYNGLLGQYKKAKEENK